jgi:tetratricopeptide (TPR) repeat protein
MAHNYSAAIEQNRNSVELDSNFAAAHLLLGEDYVQAGLHSEGVSELKRAASLSGGSPLYTAQVAVAFAVAGRKGEALRIAHELETASKKRYVSPYGLAQIYAALNSKKTHSNGSKPRIAITPSGWDTSPSIRSLIATAPTSVFKNSSGESTCSELDYEIRGVLAPCTSVTYQK